MSKYYDRLNEIADLKEKLSQEEKNLEQKTEQIFKVKQGTQNERDKLMSDRNAISVRVHNLKLKIRNLENGQPSNGSAPQTTQLRQRTPKEVLMKHAV